MGNRKSIFYKKSPEFKEALYATDDLTASLHTPSARSSSFSEMKTRLIRQPSTFIKDDSTLGATLRQILFHATLNQPLIEHAASQYADENIYYIIAITNYRDGSTDSMESTCNNIWNTFIKPNARHQINVNGLLMLQLEQAYHKKDFVTCLELFDDIMYDCLNDIKSSDWFRAFITKNSEACALFNHFNEDMLVEWFEMTDHVDLILPMCNGVILLQNLVRLVVMIRDSFNQVLRVQKSRMENMYQTFFTPHSIWYIQEHAGLFMYAFRKHNTKELQYAYIEYIQVISKYEFFTRQVRAKLRL